MATIHKDIHTTPIKVYSVKVASANPYRERWPPMALTRIIAIGGKQTVSTASHVRVTRPPTQKVLPHRALCYDSILNVIRTVLQSGLHYRDFESFEDNAA